MSTCSTATSAHHGRARRRPSCDHAVHGGGSLERRLRGLEQDWDAYKTSRSAAPRHRRSRSATGTPSSAVVTAGAEAPGLLPLLRGSPRKLVSSLQQTGSTGTDDSAGAVTVKQGKGQIRHCEEDSSSVCSLDAGSAAMAASSCSCSCECTVPCCACGYSSTSSCSGSSAAASLFPPVEGGSVVCDRAMQKRGAEEMGRVGWFAAIAVVGVVAVVGIMAMAILEFGMDEGYVEFLVPT